MDKKKSVVSATCGFANTELPIKPKIRIQLTPFRVLTVISCRVKVHRVL